jgi:hypothetical protein
MTPPIYSFISLDASRFRLDATMANVPLARIFLGLMGFDS